MREILFRGKCKTDNEWLYGFPYVTRKNAVKINWYCSEFGSMRTDEVIPETVGQYTGLTDKNGVRIFEGDIVSLTKYSGLIYKVVYMLCRYELVNSKGTNCFVLDIYKSKDIEVIGNIHDNPELLGKAENP